ncbi:hypothetical protein T484DRAFT_1823182 [Baffinella frigidus]|nr:hypothetical protein T484DRAFT_1823182 [Cryptophyta sp. CCMP2293]
MCRVGTGMKVLLLGVGWLAFLGGATAQTCTTGSKAVAFSAGEDQPPLKPLGERLAPAANP